MKEVNNITFNKTNKLLIEKNKLIKEKENMVKLNDFKKALILHNQELSINQKLKSLAKQANKINKNDIINLLSRKYNISLLKTDYLDLEKYLNKNIIGQEQAIKKIITNIKNKFDDKPTSLLLTGSTGVGKTETVKKISKYFNMNLLKLDMSEYNNESTISRLIGASAGFVGYDDGAIFDKIKLEPFTCILIDEIEKASSQVLNLFLQIFDEGIITNAKGEQINFKNTLIFATSNVKGSKKIGFMDDLKNYNHEFSKELLARFTDIIEYTDITKEDLNKYLEINKIKNIDINEFNYQKNGFRGFDKYIESKDKIKIKE